MSSYNNAILLPSVAPPPRPTIQTASTQGTNTKPSPPSMTPVSRDTGVQRSHPSRSSSAPYSHPPGGTKRTPLHVDRTDSESHTTRRLRVSDSSGSSHTIDPAALVRQQPSSSAPDPATAVHPRQDTRSFHSRKSCFILCKWYARDPPFPGHGGRFHRVSWERRSYFLFQG